MRGEEYQTGKAQWKLLSSFTCKTANRDCRMRLFIQLEGGSRSECGGISGPAGLDTSYGNYGVPEWREICLIFVKRCTIVKSTISSSGRGAIPHRRLQSATCFSAADLVRFQNRQYSLDERRNCVKAFTGVPVKAA